jgi:hypothetical protein
VIKDLSMHVWSADSAQAILWSPHVIFELAPTTMDQSDLSHFLLVSWANHPDLIPNEVRCIIPEPLEPFVKHYPPLFLRASEVIHSKRDTLQFCVFIHILELHDFSLPVNIQVGTLIEAFPTRGRKCWSTTPTRHAVGGRPYQEVVAAHHGVH